MSLFLTLIFIAAVGAAGEVDLSDKAVEEAIQGGVAFLLENQNKDGSWGGVRNATMTSSFGNVATYKCWTVGTTALATLAMLELGSGKEAERATDRGLDFLMAHANLKRPADWDVDFKVHLSQATTISTRVRGGRLVDWIIQPVSRKPDVVVYEPQPAATNP